MKMLTLPYDEYQADLSDQRVIGQGEGRDAKALQLKPLIDYIETMTAIVLDGPGCAAYFSFAIENPDEVQSELRRLLFQVGHYS